MPSPNNKFGTSAALLTPFDSQGAIQYDLLCDHARRLLNKGLESVTLFGTTGEGASISLQERQKTLNQLSDAIDVPSNLIIGVCACSIGDALSQIEQGLNQGANRFLLTPPFYFQPCDDDGLLNWHIEVLDRSSVEAQFVLYNIPQLTQCPLSLNFVQKLYDQKSDRLIAIKDSSGDWPYSQTLLEDNSLQVLIGDERSLHKAIALGGGGAISGMANLYPERLNEIVTTGHEDKALSQLVSHIVSLPVIPALKALMASSGGDTRWLNIRPPLTPLSQLQYRSLLQHINI